MQHESSITHRKNLAAGLTVEWFRSNGDTDADWSVVCYSDGSRWLFTNGDPEQLTLLGEVKDGIGKAEILETNNGGVVALYAAGPEDFADRESWIASLPAADKPEAEQMLSANA